MTEPEAAEPEKVEVDVADLRNATRAVRWLIVWGLVLSAVVVWALVQVRSVNAEQDRADAREAHEDDLEIAQVCKDGHDRYGLFESLILELVEAAAVVGADASMTVDGATPEELSEAHQAVAELMPGQLGPILGAYPPPSCDYGAAVRVLEAG